VVALAGSAVSEVVESAGLLVDEDDPEAFAGGLRTVLEDSATHATLRDHGLKRASVFTWEKSALDTIEVYREAVAASGRP
jgi:glycosyltransferase involved in cell wall biosynthesis